MNYRTYFVIGVLCFGLILCGCVSREEFAALEERVSILEKQTTVVNVETKEESTELVLDEHSSDDKTEEGLYYTLESLSNKEMAEEIKYCLSNKPYIGESFKEYSDYFKVAPFYDDSNSMISQNRGIEYKFYLDGSMDYYNPSQDAITMVGLKGIYPQMDGTIGYGEQVTLDHYYVSVDIEVFMQDYDTAVDVYNQIYEFLSLDYEDALNHTDGMHWYGTGTVRTTGKQNFLWDVKFVELEKKEGYYVLRASNAHIVDNNY